MRVLHCIAKTALFAVLCSVVILGCSKDNNNVSGPSTSNASIWIHLNGDSIEIFFSALPKIDADGEEAIQLSEFVDTTLIPMFEDRDGIFYDARPLYAYQIVGADGFSASGNQGYLDNTWDHMMLGYIVVSTGRAIFPDDLIDLPGAYNVRDVRNIYVHRKFDIETPDTVSFVELKDITSVEVTNHDGEPEDALPLRDFVEVLVTNPGDFQYNMRTLDDFGPDEDMTWAQFQTGYWLLESQKTIFTDTSLVGGRYKLQVLEKILVNQVVAP
jgi:hypothetical protein